MPEDILLWVSSAMLTTMLYANVMLHRFQRELSYGPSQMCGLTLCQYFTKRSAAHVSRTPVTLLDPLHDLFVSMIHAHV